MAAWALVLGYAFSSAIQVFVKPAEAADRLGGGGAREVGLAAGLGFISSSCSFAALAATRALWTKDARLESALAFMFASTNLVIELGVLLWISSETPPGMSSHSSECSRQATFVAGPGQVPLALRPQPRHH